MKLVVDESVDSSIIKGLRQKGIYVFSISEECSGITDAEVLKIADNLDSILITEDKDFGELAFRLRFKHKGILLIRLSELPRKERIELAIVTIIKQSNLLISKFSVLTKKRPQNQEYLDFLEFWIK
jgi:predicted nuclease of predicted toxin-antitoxin system